MSDRSLVRCRGCNAELARPFLDLGNTPLANSYLKPDQNGTVEEQFPLAVSYCHACHLVQLTDVVPPAKLFTEYLYFSSYSEIFLKHAEAMARAYIERFALDGRSRVLEIASNDGYLLQHFVNRKIPVLGVEPARNIATEARRRGIPTLNRFFGSDAVAEILEKLGQADLIVGNNVLAHVPEVNAFLDAVAACLKANGAAVFEFPYLAELLDKIEFDTIYHEHVFYYSLSSISNLAARANLEVFDVESQSIHGGSLRVFLQHRGAREIESRVTKMLDHERELGLTAAAPYDSFGRRVGELKSKLLELLTSLKADGKRLAAYGAPAKGNTLLNYCGVGTELLEFTVDRSPHKQGLLLPGSRLPILAPEALLAEKPDYTLILPWNITQEVIGQQQEYLAQGGKFIVPIPEPRIIDIGHSKS
jgi:SAM-dependent methyltransferase